jgi:hypothetical protein
MSGLTSLPLFDLSGVVSMDNAFRGCSNVTSLPLFDLSRVVSMDTAFRNCYKVQSGALALYQQVSTQAIPPSSHTNAFEYCGRDTASGQAELAQIPTDWGGTMA